MIGLIMLALLLLTAAGWAEVPERVEQSTQGSCSPNMAGIRGNPTINCNPRTIGPLRFEGSLVTREKAKAFYDFLADNDTKVVYLEIDCGTVDAQGEWAEGHDKADRCVVIDGGDPQEWIIAAGPKIAAHQFWFELNPPENRPENSKDVAMVKVELPEDSDAREFNGPKGAGWLVNKGYFSVARMTFGDAPPEIKHYILRGVKTTDVQQR